MTSNANESPACREQAGPPTDLSTGADKVEKMYTDNSKKATQWLRALVPSGPINIVTANIENFGATVKTRTFTDDAAMTAHIAAEHDKGRDIWLQVNECDASQDGAGKRPSKKNVTLIRGVHLDFDFKDLDPKGLMEPNARKKLEEKALDRILEGKRLGPNKEDRPPTAINASGGGYHVFWQYVEPVAATPENIARTEAICRHVIDTLNAGGGTQDVSRLLRVAHTTNFKPGRDRATVNPLVISGPRYSPDDFGAAARSKEENRARVEVMAIANVDELDEWKVPARVKVIIVQGHHPDEPKAGDNTRSAWLFDVVCNLVRCKVPDPIIMGIITDERFSISESVLELKGQANRYAVKQVTSAKKAVFEERESICIQWGTFRRNLAVVGQLKNAGAEIYTRGNEMVTVRIWDETGTIRINDVDVPVVAGTADIHLLNKHYLRNYASELGLSFYAINALTGKPQDVPNAPKEIFEDILATANKWKFPSLRAISHVPTLTRQEPGYDPATKLYLAFPEGKFPPIPERPSREDAMAALERILHPTRRYEWEEACSRSVFASAFMTAVIRQSHPGLYPMFCFDASKIGSGKTKLATACGSASLGGAPPPLRSWEPNPAEFAKAFFASLLAGSTVMIYDNVKVPLINSELEGALTAMGAYEARRLGASEMPNVSPDVLIIATGNNMRFGTDMTRRVLRCGLDPKDAHPEDRSFDFDPVDEYRSAMPQMVADVLTILRAYRLAGDEVEAIPHDFTGFRLIQRALVWLGQVDPLESRAGVRERDTEEEKLIQLFSSIAEKTTVGNAFHAADLEHHYDELHLDGLVEARGKRSPGVVIGKALARIAGKKAGPLELRVENTLPKTYRFVSVKECDVRIPF